jgi:hypothetical protein
VVSLPLVFAQSIHSFGFRFGLPAVIGRKVLKVQEVCLQNIHSKRNKAELFARPFDLPIHYFSG